MARRFVGKISLRIVYQSGGMRDWYTVTMTYAGHQHAHVDVNAPAAGFGPGIAYDSPAAFDQTARAAISLCDNEDVQCEAAQWINEDGKLFVQRPARSKGRWV